MPLDKHKFKFQPHYIGWWTHPEIPDNKISGTLFIDGNKMWIELYFKPNSDDFPEKIETLTGCTSGMDADGKEYSANISVEGLEYERWCHLENGLWHYTYSVSRMFIYENILQRDNISSICVRANILDKWCSDYLESSYVAIPYEHIPYGHHIIHHTLPHLINIFKNDKLRVSLSFPCAYSIGGINQYVNQQVILKISFNNRCSFQDSLSYVNQIQNLFYILTNRVFPIDYLYSEDGRNVFVYKANEFSLYKFIEKQPDLTPHVVMNDFSDDELTTIFKKWNELYSEHGDALNSYFEIHTNIYTPPSAKIKGFISTIDSLSKEMLGPKSGVDIETNRAKYLLQIIDKYNIQSCDANELKTRFLKVTGTELKTRFSNLMKPISKYLSDDIDSDFVTKVVNTRHNITHPKANMQPCFPLEDYCRVASQLNRIILTHILVILGVPEKCIHKVLKASGCANTLS